MHQTTRFLIAVAGLQCACASPAQFPVVPYIETTTLSPVEALGYEIYWRDVAAWRGTDAVRAQGVDLGEATVRGWIVSGREDAAIVSFIGGAPADPTALFDVRLDVRSPRPGHFVRHPQGRTLAAQEGRAWHARETAVATPFMQCSAAYNTVVLEQEKTGNWLVYLLAASAEPLIHVGGNHRMTVSPDGERVLATFSFSKSCFSLPPPEDSAAGAWFTQLVSDDPLETTIFLSLRHQIPFYFRVPEGSVWVAEAGRLRRLRVGRNDAA